MLCLVQHWLLSFLLVNWKMAKGKFRSPIKDTDEEIHVRLKYEPRVVKHVRHNLMNEKHDY